MDAFAQIAHKGAGGRLEQLTAPYPPEKTTIDTALQTQNFTPLCSGLPKIETAQALRTALEAARAQYAPFLRCLAPEAKSTRTVLPLRNFQWYRQEAGPQTAVAVTLPHYGGPLGRATCVYETSFACDALPCETRHAFLVLSGADYKARVYVNNVFAGMHEGFFATFEFDVTSLVHAGQNLLRIELENDYAMLGSKGEDSDETLYGDKIYAATGPGYDDPVRGWHHCPPGMGLFDKVTLEVRAPLFVSDIFTRTLDEAIEVWVEVTSCVQILRQVNLDVSLYGENHAETVFEHRVIAPGTKKAIGLGDTFTEVIARRENSLDAALPLPCARGRNVFRFKLPRAGLKLWQPGAPYLYQLQISVLDAETPSMPIYDTLCGTFGVRTFTQDTAPETQRKGMFYLNGQETRLRGANTMGFEQQDVMREDFAQLVDDILLAKLCNMNFLRLTQRPVQREVYDVCDRLGLMTQTDLPLFGCLRRQQFCEAVRQAEEMERHVRRHACNIMVTYINEPFPNAHNQPNMNLTRPELEQFFAAADLVVRLNNPDRVIKHVDGDYDPPSATMPDNHCYPMWYNGHGIDIGRLHKGYWMPVKPGWYYGCGEFGCEGLEDEATMRGGYPESWLPQPGEDESQWSPARIVNAQTENFHHYFYEQQHTLATWIAESQKFQAFATRMMTEAFRRDAHVASFAIHLFIDAFPSGWMKTIMDCNRRPKPAFFAYRNALAPILLSLRCDRLAYSGGETLQVESWLCNDTHRSGACKIRYELYENDTPIALGEGTVSLHAVGVAYGSTASFTLPHTAQRTHYTLKAYLLTEDGTPLAENSLCVDGYPAVDLSLLNVSETDSPRFVVKNISTVCENDLNRLTQNGGVLFVEAAEPGVYTLPLPKQTVTSAPDEIVVKESGMSPMHFAARDTGHAWVTGFTPYDFRLWYDAQADCIAPLADSTATAPGFAPVLASRNLSANGQWEKALLLSERACGKGRVVLSQIAYRRLLENPAGRVLLKTILDETEGNLV